jgi:hypothetical protein
MGSHFPKKGMVIFFLILLGYGIIRFYIGARDIIAPVILCLAWTGGGTFELEYRIRHTNWLTKSSHNSRAGFMNMRWILLILVVLALLPKPLAPQRAEKIPIKEAGIWIKEHGARNPVVMTKGRLARIAFYADGPFLEVPKDQDLFEYARKNRVDFLAINEKDIEESHPYLFGEKLRYSGEQTVVFGH